MQSHTALHGLSVADASTKHITLALMITLNADRADTESLLTNSSALFLLTRCRPDICRQLLANVSSGTGTHRKPKTSYVAAVIFVTFKMKITFYMQILRTQFTQSQQKKEWAFLLYIKIEVKFNNKLSSTTSSTWKHFLVWWSYHHQHCVLVFSKTSTK